VRGDGKERVTYRFDEFTVQPHTRRVLRNDEEMHLSPKAFDLLTILIANRAQAMAKADLQQKLWPSTFVLEGNLAGLIAEIRQALGDSAEKPRFIRTMHRFGYWFIGAVVEQGPEVAAGTPARYWLLWETRQIPLDTGENVLGRAPDAAVWIDAPGVSRYHARIRVAGTEALIEDLGSKNGTFLRGQSVTAPCRLQDGDQIRLGSVLITFRIPPPGGATETALG
jgi:DNA-binding winged helix-turn-helix (wHTH) protein